MILRALTDLHARLSEEGKAARPGFQEKPIPFLIVIDRGGNFMGLTDTTSPDAKRGITRVVPREEVRSGKNAWQKANILWDSPAYLLGVSDEKPEEARKKHKAFKSKIREVFPSVEIDEGVRAVLAFLERGDFTKIFSHPSWPTVLAMPGNNMTFQLENEGLVCQRPAVVAAVATVFGREVGEKVQCLVSGEMDIPVATHGKTRGVRDAQSSGANVVSFNLKAFNSYDKEQGLNAPVGRRAEFAYGTALNTLLANQKRRLLVGDTTTVFWAEKKSVVEDLFADLFGEPAKENPDQAVNAIRALYAAPATGTPPLDEDYTPFYVLGLSPNAARLSVRFWHPGTVGETVRNIKRHFDDCRIDHGPKQPEYLSLFRLLSSTAVQGKSENIPHNLAGEFMKSILAGTSYPRTALSVAVTRCRAERDVTYSRGSLIKALLARYARLRNPVVKEVGMSLDTSFTSPGYLLGRLFSVLEKIQEEANPGINATIRDRFYGGASGTPVVAFQHLMKLKNHHLAKFDNRGRAVNMERLIGEIVDKLPAPNPFPAHLSLDEQGRFAVGYYHQRQAFFTKSEKSKS